MLFMTRAQLRLMMLAGLVAVAVPLVVYGSIVSLTRYSAPDLATPALFSTELKLPVESGGAPTVNNHVSACVALLIVLGVSIIVSLGYPIFLSVVLEPPFKAPRVRCLREVLEEEYPTWYR